ncbi:hypothetical protein D3C84_1024410 [compost metagenome]
MVQIQQQRCQRFRFALGFVHGLCGQQIEAATVRQFGQAVEGRLRLDLALITLDHPVEQGQHSQGHE